MTIQLSNETIVAGALWPIATEARATYRLENTGDVFKFVNGVATDVGDWINPKTGMSDYECRATLASGQSPSSGALGTWQGLETSREWNLVDEVRSGGFLNSTLTIEIRDKATQTVQASATISLNAMLTS